MAIQLKTEAIDIKMENFYTKEYHCSKVDLSKDDITGDPEERNLKYLKFYTSLIGEGIPNITELPNNYIGDLSKAYRYDWLFGLSCISKNKKGIRTDWDWKAKLRENDSVKVQLLFECRDAFVHIISANLLCLNPSKNSNSWFEKNRESINNTLSSISSITKEYSNLASDIFNVANTLTNFIASDDNGKNWYLYKFLDQEKNSFAVEWVINKKVLDQYGPMLQGSVVVNFHSASDAKPQIKLHIRPSISFMPKEDLSYVSPYEKMNMQHYIEINPK